MPLSFLGNTQRLVAPTMHSTTAVGSVLGSASEDSGLPDSPIVIAIVTSPATSSPSALLSQKRTSLMWAPTIAPKIWASRSSGVFAVPSCVVRLKTRS